MKYVASLTALALASAAVIATAAPEGAGGRHHQHGSGMERLKQADTNGDGNISAEEAKALPRLAKHFAEIDANGNGQITPDEMRAHREKMHAEHGQKRAERMADRWKKFDTDGDGRVSLAEAKANAPRFAEHFPAIDANGDGFVTPEEMKAAHQRHAKHK